MFKTVLVALVCCAALAAGNPAVGVEWRWKPRHITVSPNIKALPFKKLVETFVPEVRIPGTKIVANCGPTRAAQSRIVGGREAVPHSYPWQVALFIDDGLFCGGSIINEDWVLTAAHCMDGARIVEVVAGAHNIRLNEATQVSMTTTNFFVHENWGSIFFKNDIALIRLPRSLSWTNAIAPICLPSYSDSDLPIGTWVNPSGWGRPSDSQSAISNVLREVTVPVMSNVLCELVFGNLVSENVICIDSSGGKGPCNGDSGGPMNYVKLGKTYNRGIVSFGSTTGCEAGYPDAFTRTKNYLAWISRKTGIYIDP